MISKKHLGIWLSLILWWVSFPIAAHAQEDVVASGLNGPRHIIYDSDGTLYIAEAGTGGNTTVKGIYGKVKVGQTSQITAVSPDGKQSVFIPNLLSMDSDFGDIRGAHMLYPTQDAFWLVLGSGPVEDAFNGAKHDAVLELDRQTLAVKQTIDLRAFEEANNPDGGAVDNNPIKVAFGKDGTMYIADAGCNCVESWTPKDGLKVFAVWAEGDDNPVPTSVVVGPDGDIYVGFLTGYPFPVGGARIERYTPDGKKAQTYIGLTLVTDILITSDGTLYAVEMASSFGDAGYVPNSGRVLKVTDNGLVLIADKLNFPFGIAQDPQGKLVVTANSAFSDPNSGEVIRITNELNQPLSEAGPATTPEAQPAATTETSGG
jgi:sugar lactone lactonase YvrE